MSTDMRELSQIWAQLTERQRAEVVDFARCLLASADGAMPNGATDRWLASARGAATKDVTTENVMALTRGEP